MRILYITSYPLEYSSSANMRNIALIKGLIENGNEVHTLSTSLDKESSLYDNSLLNINIKKRYWIELGNIHKKISTKSGEKFKKKILDFAYKMYMKINIYDSRAKLAKKVKDLKIDNNYDVIISSSDPKSAHLFAEELINNNPNITKRWIQYWGDPFASDINRKSLIPKSIVKNEEKRLISKCDKVIYVSPFTLEAQMKLYPNEKEKMIFAPIAYIDEKTFPKTNNQNVTLGYFGDYKKNDRNICELYKCCIDNGYNLVVTGNSDLKLEETSKIKIMPRQKKSIIEEYEKKCDILVCICNKSGTQIPGKVYHYSCTNKPILIILDGSKTNELKKYFGSFERFYMCLNDSNEIQKEIKKIKEENKTFEPCKKLSSKYIAKQLIEEMK